ncbi:MAG: transposase [Oscillospiraceae bacterium]|nr:transposase [Oscillospiraceae bacterium]
MADYDYSKEGFYFLTVCTRERKQILSEIVSDDTERRVKVKLSPLGTIVQSFIETIPGIDKYVIMPNHVHLIVHKTNGKSLFSDIRSFKSLVTKRIGVSIWQDSYYDHVIRNREDYLEKWRYIDENPAKWAEDEYNA